MLKYLLWKVFELFRSPLSKGMRLRDLIDVPHSYIGKSGKSLMVKVLENGTEFSTPGVSADNLDGGSATTTYTMAQRYDGGASGTSYTDLTKIDCGGIT